MKRLHELLKNQPICLLIHIYIIRYSVFKLIKLGFKQENYIQWQKLYLPIVLPNHQPWTLFFKKPRHSKKSHQIAPLPINRNHLTDNYNIPNLNQPQLPLLYKRLNPQSIDTTSHRHPTNYQAKYQQTLLMLETIWQDHQFMACTILPYKGYHQAAQIQVQL